MRLGSTEIFYALELITVANRCVSAVPGWSEAAVMTPNRPTICENRPSHWIRADVCSDIVPSFPPTLASRPLSSAPLHYGCLQRYCRFPIFPWKPRFERRFPIYLLYRRSICTLNYRFDVFSKTYTKNDIIILLGGIGAHKLPINLFQKLNE